MKKRSMVILLLFVVISLLFWGLVMIKRSNEPKLSKSNWIPLEEIPADYTLEDAKDDGYVIIENGDVSYGQRLWAEFYEEVDEKNPTKIRVVDYYSIIDKSHYDADYYESIKDDYPMLFVKEISYDGSMFTELHYEEEKKYEYEYKYLIRDEGEAESEFATYSSYIRYILVDDNTVTWKDIWKGLISSQSGAGVRHSVVYTDLLHEGE